MPRSYSGINNNNYKRVQQRLALEYRELDDPVIKTQLLLDRMWQAQLDERAAQMSATP